MKKIFQLVFCLLGALWINVASAQLYKVDNVAVSAERASAMEAKEAALAEGQVVAFQRLIARLSPDSGTQLPEMTPEEVLSYVSGVSIESEKTTATKYIGRIAVEFNPTAVKEFLNSQQMTYLRTQAPTLLVIPEYVTAEGTKLLSDDNPLYQALKEQKNFAPFYQAVVPEGTEEEVNLLQQDISLSKSLLPVYQKDKVMILRLEFQGGTIWEISSSFYPSSGMKGQEVRKQFDFNSQDIKRAAVFMSEAVFKEMEQRWRHDRTSSFDDKQTLYLRVNVDSLADWLALEQERKSWTFFEETTLKGVFLPLVLIEATYKGDEEKIQTQLLNNGWQLEKDFSGDGATLTKVENNE